MKITEYLLETEYAAKNIIDLIVRDKQVLVEYESNIAEVEKQIDHLKETIKLLYKDAISKDMSDDFVPAQVQHAYYRYAQKHFDELPALEKDLKNLIEIKNAQIKQKLFLLKCYQEQYYK